VHQRKCIFSGKESARQSKSPDLNICINIITYIIAVDELVDEVNQSRIASLLYRVSSQQCIQWLRSTQLQGANLLRESPILMF
jgi:hypothetical protein